MVPRESFGSWTYDVVERMKRWYSAGRANHFATCAFGVSVAQLGQDALDLAVTVAASAAATVTTTQIDRRGIELPPSVRPLEEEQTEVVVGEVAGVGEQEVRGDVAARAGQRSPASRHLADRCTVPEPRIGAGPDFPVGLEAEGGADAEGDLA